MNNQQNNNEQSSGMMYIPKPDKFEQNSQKKANDNEVDNQGRRKFLQGLGAATGAAAIGTVASALGIKGVRVAGEVFNGPKPEVVMPEDFIKMVPVLANLKKIYEETKGEDKIKERFARLTELMFSISETERKYISNISLSLEIKLLGILPNTPARIRFDVRGFDKSSTVKHPNLTKDENYQPEINAKEIGESGLPALNPFIADSPEGQANEYATKQQIIDQLMLVMDSFKDSEINNSMIDFVPVPYSVPPQGVLNKFLTDVYQYNGWKLPDLSNLDCTLSIFLGDEPIFWFQLQDKQKNQVLSFTTKTNSELIFATTLVGPDSELVADFAHGYENAPIWQEWKRAGTGRLASSEILGQVLPQLQNLAN